jgi:hypothetical protein
MEPQKSDTEDMTSGLPSGVCLISIKVTASPYPGKTSYQLAVWFYLLFDRYFQDSAIKKRELALNRMKQVGEYRVSKIWMEKSKLLR